MFRFNYTLINIYLVPYRILLHSLQHLVNLFTTFFRSIIWNANVFYYLILQFFKQYNKI